MYYSSFFPLKDVYCCVIIRSTSSICKCQVWLFHLCIVLLEFFSFPPTMLFDGLIIFLIYVLWWIVFGGMMLLLEMFQIVRFRFLESWKEGQTTWQFFKGRRVEWWCKVLYKRVFLQTCMPSSCYHWFINVLLWFSAVFWKTKLWLWGASRDLHSLGCQRVRGSFLSKPKLVATFLGRHV